MLTIDPRYPIGKFQAKESYTSEELTHFIQSIQTLPDKIRQAIVNLSLRQLDTPYRDGGWTVRQVVHHVADSHMNAYVRFKWTLTESTPTIKAYDEKGWAQTPEIKSDPALSLALLTSLHAKWVVLLKDLTTEDLKKEFIHPETGKHVRLDQLMGLYTWHGEHHLAHITSLKEKMKW